MIRKPWIDLVGNVWKRGMAFESTANSCCKYLLCCSGPSETDRCFSSLIHQFPETFSFFFLFSPGCFPRQTRQRSLAHH